MNIGGNINSIKNISIADIRHKPEVLGFGNQELELWMRKHLTLESGKQRTGMKGSWDFNFGELEQNCGSRQEFYI